MISNSVIAMFFFNVASARLGLLSALSNLCIKTRLEINVQ